MCQRRIRPPPRSGCGGNGDTIRMRKTALPMTARSSTAFDAADRPSKPLRRVSPVTPRHRATAAVSRLQEVTEARAEVYDVHAPAADRRCLDSPGHSEPLVSPAFDRDARPEGG